MTSNCGDLKTKRLYTACVAELLGTMLLVLVACGAAQNASGDSKILTISLAFGFSVGTIVWMIGHISGGHINPAVTIGLVAARRITIIRGVLYIGAQVLGALIGAAILGALTPGDNPSLGHCTVTRPVLDVDGTVLTPGINTLQAFGVELMEGFILVFVVFSSIDANRTGLGGSIPLTVGIAIAMCHLWAIKLTGSAMNPARALGPAILRDDLGDQWLYWAGPLTGGAIAGLLYDFLFAVNAGFDKIQGCCSLDYDDADFDRDGRKIGRSSDFEMKA